MKLLLAMLLGYRIGLTFSGQSSDSFLPHEIEPEQRYLFYQHGALVTEMGNNAINQSVPEWGPYEYLSILDSLRSRGFNVLSEQRVKGVPDAVYAVKIVDQIDSLRKAGVPWDNIVVVGASAGWNITLQVSSMLKNPKAKFVMMGGCWPDSYKEYEQTPLYGRFLSIIEATDPHGTCAALFARRKHIKRYLEITLSTGLSHGFIYKGYPAWIDPMITWFEEN